MTIMTIMIIPLTLKTILTSTRSTITPHDLVPSSKVSWNTKICSVITITAIIGQWSTIITIIIIIKLLTLLMVVMMSEKLWNILDRSNFNEKPYHGCSGYVVGTGVATTGRW